MRAEAFNPFGFMQREPLFWTKLSRTPGVHKRHSYTVKGVHNSANMC